MKRQVNSFSHSLERRLNGYLLAAGAAGAGVMVLASPAEAKIVYTRTHHRIRLGQHLLLDLNHDGVTDFEIYLSGQSGSRKLRVAPGNTQGTNAVWGRESSRWSAWCAAALSSGIRVGPERPLQHRNLLMVETFGGGERECQWMGQPSANLGLRFTIAGETHYGWARLSTVSGIFLNGYAYETIPNKPIIAGQEHGRNEATLGHLATGASAIPAWRVKPTAATSH